MICHPILLCGFMASGKTTIGQLLSEKLSLPFYDTDAMIIAKTGHSIPELFSLYGESGFRDIEHDIAGSIPCLSPCVVSTGGGLLTFSRNGDLLKGKTTIVLLDRSFDLTWESLITCQDRPLVKGKTKEDVKVLYDARVPLYRKYADIVLPNDDTPEAAVAALQKILES